MKPQAIVLYSSGLDSTTCLAIARADGFMPTALSFNYGQRHSVEIEKAKKYYLEAGAERHVIVNIDLKQVGGSALTADIDVPKDRHLDDQIPVTYVPARNTIFLSYALAWAEVLNVFDIYIGVNALDYSGYPDCRPEFISAFETMANLATKAAVDGKGHYRIHTPLLHLTKGEIIQKGTALGVNYSLTHSCYDPSPAGLACGHCDSCVLRLKGFAAAGQHDPVGYVEKSDAS